MQSQNQSRFQINLDGLLILALFSLSAVIVGLGLWKAGELLHSWL